MKLTVLDCIVPGSRSTSERAAESASEQPGIGVSVTQELDFPNFETEPFEQEFLVGRSETPAMDEDEREEFMKIRERELKQMERKLEEKQRELDAHVAANEKMQQLLADSARGEHLTAEEAQRMIADHAQEIDELRQESDRRVGKLQAELASAREALDRRGVPRAPPPSSSRTEPRRAHANNSSSS